MITNKFGKIEVFYTGGGIWLAACHFDNKRYYIVDSDFSDCLSLYDDAWENGEEYPCVSMVGSWGRNELKSLPIYGIYKDMKKALYDELGNLYTGTSEKYNYYESVKADVDRSLLNMATFAPWEELTTPKSNAELRDYIKDELMEDKCVCESDVDIILTRERVLDNHELVGIALDYWDVSEDDYLDAIADDDYLIIDKHIRQYLMCQIVDMIVDEWEEVSIQRFWECL